MSTHPSYEIFEELGRGEDSVVMRGYDLNLSREVAIKQVASKGESADRSKKLLQEAAFLAQFEHENILRIYSVEPAQGWIVMELMNGTLAAQIASQPMPADMVRSVVQQVLRALEFLHGKSKVHGAVRPSNLLINEHGTVKLSDFEDTGNDGELRVPTGSKKYLAPELIRPEFGEFGSGVDLYCLGFTALELLMGRKFHSQFPGTGKGAIDEDVAWLRWHSSDESLKSVRKMVPSCPADLADLIDSLLKKTVSERPANASAALGQLDDKPLVAVPVMTQSAEDGASRGSASMLPGDASLREWSPLPKKPAKDGSRESKRKKRVPVAAGGKTLNDYLEKPYVLWPLCTAILLGALLVGWKINQSSPADVSDDIVVRFNIIPDANEAQIQIDGQSVDAQDGLYPMPAGMRRVTVQKTDFETYEAILSISEDEREFDIALVSLKPPQLVVTKPKDGEEDQEKVAVRPVVELAKKEDKQVIKEKPVVVVEKEKEKEKASEKEREKIDFEKIAERTELKKDESGLYELTARLIGNPDGTVEAPGPEIDALAAEFTGKAELVIDSKGFISEITDISFSPNGQMLAVGGAKCVRIWDLNSGDLLHTLRGDRSRTSYGSVSAVAFSADGSELLVGVTDYAAHGSIRVYDTSNFDEIKELLAGHPAPCRKICFSRDNEQMASVDSNGTILVWDWRSRKVAKQIPARDPDNLIYDGLTFPTDKPFLLGLDYKGPRALSAVTGKDIGGNEMPSELRGWHVDVFSNLVKYPFGVTRQPRVLDFRMERSVWAAAGVGKKNGQNRFWVGVWESRDPQTTPNPAKQLGQYVGHRWSVSTIEIGPQENLVASGDKFGEVHVWDYKSGKRLFRFAGQGKPIYEVAFEENSTRLAFGTKPYTPKDWRRNNYGKASRVLDLKRRAILDSTSINDFQVNNEQSTLGGGTVSVSRSGSNYSVFLQVGQKQTAYPISSARNPTVYTLLERQRLGVERPVVFGDNDGLLALWDSSGSELKRVFVGHGDLVSAVSPATGGKLIASSSTDRTIRLWSLEDHRSTGIFDFKFETTTVTKVLPGSSSAKAGVRVGDKIESIDGLSLREMFDLMLEGKFEYRPGQTVPVVVIQNGSPLSYEMKLAEGYDFVDPVLNVFIGDDDRWIIWSPEGYYDASPGADQLIGWHVNRGPAKSARYYEVQQFRKELYRPDVIDGILRTGSVDEALNSIRTARSAQGAGGSHSEEDSIDFRNPRELALNHPPTVEFQSPKRDGVLTKATLPVKFDVRSVNGLPIQEVTLLHNGSVAKVFRPRKSNPTSMTVEHQLRLVPGQNNVAVVAGNAKASSAVEEVQIRFQSDQREKKGDAYVLSIGVSEYATADLNGAKNAAVDAARFGNLVSAKSNARLYDQVHRRLLTDEKATRAAIVDGLQWLMENVKDGDTVMIFAATQGLADARENFYLASHDVNVERLRASGVAWRDIIDTLHFDLPDCKRFVFLDVVAGASMLNSDMRNPLLDLASPEQGITFLSSNTLKESGDGSTKRVDSAFLNAITQTIRDSRFDVTPENGDRMLNSVELAAGVAKHVHDFTSDGQHPVFFTPPAARRTNVLEQVNR